MMHLTDGKENNNLSGQHENLEVTKACVKLQDQTEEDSFQPESLLNLSVNLIMKHGFRVVYLTCK